MAPRIVVFGATGFTGRLTVKALAGQGQRPLLAGRSPDRLSALARQYDDLDYAIADVTEPESIAGLLNEGDVLLSLAGPFVKLGAAAVQAAISRRAHYLDSTGEPPFIRKVFEEYGPRAEAAGIVLLTAMGYDYVPGQLAACLALRDAGPDATGVRIGYFVSGRAQPGSSLSGGTLASLSGVLLENSYRLQNGALHTERPGVRYHQFDVGGRSRGAVSVGMSEQFTLPVAFPGVRDVDTYLGWFGPASRAISLVSRTAGAALAFAPVRTAMNALTGRLFKGSSGGPDDTARQGQKTLVIAEALNASGQQSARAVVGGASPYDFTARMLAWSAARLLTEGSTQTGALGPATAFGLEPFAEGARTAGIERVE